MKTEIIYEDESYDLSFEAGELDEAEAVTLVGCSKSLASVTTVRSARDTVSEYLARYENDPFSAEAAAFLREALAPLFGRFGYEADPDSPFAVIAFSPDADLGRSFPLPDGARIVWCGEGEGEKYDFSLIEGGEDDGRCALALRGDTVLCAAGINDLRRDGYCEIYVECAGGERRKGLGSACVLLLCRRLAAEGQGVRYETTGDNEASIALARSLGMREIERTVTFGARRLERDVSPSAK